MELRKVPLSEAMGLPLAFDLPDDFMEQSRASLEVCLREQGWKGNRASVAASKSGDKKVKK